MPPRLLLMQCHGNHTAAGVALIHFVIPATHTDVTGCSVQRVRDAAPRSWDSRWPNGRKTVAYGHREWSGERAGSDLWTGIPGGCDPEIHTP